MPFKFVILFAIFAVVSAGYLAPVSTHYDVVPAVNAKVANPVVDAVASSHQNVIRSFGGTVSQHSKLVQAPYSSVHKEDTRVNNNIYTPATAKTITYTASDAAKTVSYSSAPASAAFYTTHSNPVVTKTVYAHQEPTRANYASSAPHTIYTPKQPVHDAAKTVSYSSAPASAAFYTTHSNPVVTKTVYAHQEPTRANYASSAPHTIYTPKQPVHDAAKTVSYSSAPASAAFYTTHSNPVVTKTVYAHQEPTRANYASSAPHTIYTPKQPVHDFYASPTPSTTGHTHQDKVPATISYNQSPAATTYTHTSPKISAYGSRQTVHYSPAEMVSHVSFDGFGTHWGS